jgi:hypothetical protein
MHCTGRIPKLRFCQVTKNVFAMFMLFVEFASAIRPATFSLLALLEECFASKT